LFVTALGIMCNITTHIELGGTTQGNITVRYRQNPAQLDTSKPAPNAGTKHGTGTLAFTLNNTPKATGYYITTGGVYGAYMWASKRIGKCSEQKIAPVKSAGALFWPHSCAEEIIPELKRPAS
jgi:hypothetical protein